MPIPEPEAPGSCKKADRAACLIIFLVTTALFIPAWTRGLTTLLPTYEDQTQWHLYRLFINQVFSSGHFPLWCPHLYAGMNFIGWAHASVFYPAGIIFYLLDYLSAIPVNQWFHILLGSMGIYYLARVIRIRPLAACLAALWFGLGHLVPSFQENFLPLVFALGFSPWIYAFLYRLIDTRKIKYLLLASAFMGIQWLSGHIEALALQYEIIGVGFLLLLGIRFRRRPSALFMFVSAILLGAALGLLQFIPALEETTRSIRSLGVGYPLFTLFSQPVLWFEAWPLWLSVANIFTILAVIYGLARIIKDPRVALIAVLLFLTLAINFNWFNVLFLVYKIPLLNKLIPHGLMLHQTFMLMALLVGIGIDNLRFLFNRRRAMRIFAVALLLEATTVFILLHVFHLHDKVQIDPVAQDAIMHFFQARLFAGYALGILAVILLVLSFFRSRASLGSVMLGFVLALEFIPAALANIPQRPKNVLDYNTEYMEFFEAQKERARSLIVYPFDSYHELDIPLQSGVLYGAEAPDAYITLSTLRYTEFMSLLDPDSYKLENDKIADIQTPNILKRGDFIGPETIPLINLLNLKYIVSQNKNIKAATHYFLAYELYRFSHLEGEVRKIEWNDIELATPSAFGLNIHFHKGDRLRFGLKIPEKTRPGLVLIGVAEILNHKEKNVIFEKIFDLRQSKEKGNIDISLEDIRDSTTTLSISAQSVGENGPDRVIMVWPHIYNPGKHFLRLNLKDVNIFKNPTAMRRAFLVHDYRVIPETESRLNFMKSPEFLPDRIAILETEPGLKKTGLEGTGAMLPGEGVLIKKYESDEAQIMVRAKTPGLLVISDQYSPGWRVFVDSKEQPILRADHAFRAVKVDKGYHLVNFRYQPKSFSISLYFFIVSWLFLFFMIALKRLGLGRAGKLPT